MPKTTLPQLGKKAPRLDSRTLRLADYLTTPPFTSLSMTAQFYQAYSDEAYAVLSPDWFNANGQAFEGFNLAQLKADLAALG